MPAMSSTVQPFSPERQLQYAAEVVRIEARALLSFADRLGPSFCEAIDLIRKTQGSVLVTGMGKASIIAQKIAATFASTGTVSHFIHPAEAIHGDLGRIRSTDTMVILSQSGETAEIVELLGPLEELGPNTIAVTRGHDSTLGRAADVVLELGPLQEACPLGLAPTTSTTVMAALGDAMALAVSRMRAFSARDFVRFHPGGSLGRRLTTVESRMRPLANCRIAKDSLSIREVFLKVSIPGRRTGAIMLVDEGGKLTGIFTDSDLARLFENRRESDLDKPIRIAMTREPCSCPAGAMLSDAVEIMAERRISELPVVDENSVPVGMVDVTDVLATAGSLRAIRDQSTDESAEDNRPVTLRLAKLP